MYPATFEGLWWGSGGSPFALGLVHKRPGLQVRHPILLVVRRGRPHCRCIPADMNPCALKLP